MWRPTMKRVIRDLMMRLTPKRLPTPDESQERADIVNRLYDSAARLSRHPRVTDTPEELLDYHRADTIMARGRR